METGRSRLRAYALVSDVVDAKKRLAVKQETEAGAESMEVTQPPTQVARVDLVLRPPGMPPMMPTPARGSASRGPWAPSGGSVATLAASAPPQQRVAPWPAPRGRISTPVLLASYRPTHTVEPWTPAGGSKVEGAGNNSNRICKAY